MRDYYYLSEIIFGLRSEYKRISEELESLKEDISVDTNRLYDFYFRIVELENKKAQLECFFREKKGKIKRFFKRLAMESGFLYHDGMYSECEKDQDNIFKIKPSHFALKITNQEAFDRKADLIMNSLFVKNMSIQEKVIPESSGSLSVLHSGLRFATLSDEVDGLMFLDYQAHEDALFFGSFSEDLQRNSLTNILMMPIAKNNFSSFHQRAIDHHSLGKEVVVDDSLVDTTFARLDIHEDSNQIILKRSK